METKHNPPKNRIVVSSSVFLGRRSSAAILIHIKMITNEDLEICFRIRCRNGKAKKFPQIFFRICFRNDHVGHAQATTAGHTYEIDSNPGNYLSLSLS